jgi:hypothetical protein
MPSNSILSTTCCLLAIGALATLTILPDEAATAPPQEQVSNEARTPAPAPATAAPCQCDPTLQTRLQELELEHAALVGRYYELAAKVEQFEAKAVAKSATTQPAATIRNYRIVQPQASGYCVGGNCSTSRGRVGIFGRRR